MRFPRTPARRAASSRRSMTPGAAGGHSDVVAPPPRDVRPMKSTPGGLPSDWSIADADTVTSDSDMKFSGKIRAVDPLDPYSYILIDPTFSAPYLKGHATTGEDWAVVASPGQVSLEMNIAGARSDVYSGLVGGSATSFVRASAPAGTAELMVTDSLAFLQIAETADPGASPAGTFTLFAQDNGSGKMQLCVRFPTGAAQVIATEP